jgi:hypothetical protein
MLKRKCLACARGCVCRAEYIGVGQKSSALDALETVIKSKRHRQWSPILEDIVKKFLSLCTEAQQQRRAREGLVQYRQITQQATAGPESIRKVVANFVMEGEAKVREAEEKAGLGADAVANLQDLEAEETPETMLISVLTGDLSDTGRADRDNYVKWLRFLWESYRMCLEVLKNNAKLEELYAVTRVPCVRSFRRGHAGADEWGRCRGICVKGGMFCQTTDHVGRGYVVRARAHTERERASEREGERARE